jgi:hypothetical protein
MSRETIGKILESLGKGIQVDLDGKPVRLSPSSKKFVNKRLHELFGVKYFEKIPLDEIFGFLKSEDIIVVQEDGTPWEGFLTGAEGRTTFELALYDTQADTFSPIGNAVLWMSWYKMSSGRYEIVAYLS